MGSGWIGIRYPEVVENEPLNAPVGIESISAGSLKLLDGRAYTLDPHWPDEGWFKQCVPGTLVEIEEVGGGEVTVWANRPGWICGTPWAEPIRIPLIRDVVYRNRREILTFAIPAADGGPPPSE